MYTASLYVALASIVHNKHSTLFSSHDNFILVQEGQRVLMFSYGSGLASTIFSFKIWEGQHPFTISNIAEVMDLESKLESRNEFSPEDFVSNLKLMESLYGAKGFVSSAKHSLLRPGTFYLTEVDDKFRRFYSQKLVTIGDNCGNTGLVNGGKYGGYGSFLPTHQRSPSVLLQPRTPAIVQNYSMQNPLNEGTAEADVDKNGKLEFGKFFAVSVHLQRMDNDEHLRKAFTFFDKNGSGYIEIDELKEGLADGLGQDDEEVLNDIVREVDTDKDGRISYEEFVAMMKTGTDWRKASRHYSRERFNNLSVRLMKDGSLQMTSDDKR